MERVMNGANASKGLRVWIVLVVFAAGVLGGLWLAQRWSARPAADGVVKAKDAGALGFAEVFRRKVSDPAFDGVAVAMAVLDEDGEVWFASPLARTAMCPASALKVLTTGAALARLGPEFRFGTKLAATAAPTGDVIEGDLVLIGGGDPTLTVGRLETLAGLVVQSGVRRIDGRVRADASLFPENPMSDHWNWGDVGNAYGAGAFGLNVNHNRMVLRFRPGRADGADAGFAGADPSPPGVVWNHRVTTGPAGSGDRVVVYSEPYGNRVTTRGTVPAGAGEFHVRAAIPDPPAMAARVVRDALAAAGVEVTGRERSAAGGEVVLARTSSVTLADLVRSINHTSDNVEAQCLFLALDPGGDPAAVVRRHWEDAGVEFAALRLLDGSGLARANMIRAVDLAAVMHAGLASEHGETLHESLPVHQDGMVRSKPGGMSGVTTGVGTITAANGRRMAYAFMANGVPDTRVTRDLRERLRAAVARYAEGG